LSTLAGLCCRRILGGLDEIMRTIISEPVLGMSGDICIDKDKPFNRIPPGGACVGRR
jgi:hypothetical protein